MLSFHKNRECPTSEDLLAFQNGCSPTGKSRFIREHICSCDFCGAEADFYSRYPQTAHDKISVTEIPDHLFELAQALLNNRENGGVLLKRLIKESEGSVA